MHNSGPFNRYTTPFDSSNRGSRSDFYNKQSNDKVKLNQVYEYSGVENSNKTLQNFSPVKARKEVSLPAIDQKSGTHRLESNLPKELLSKIDGH